MLRTPRQSGVRGIDAYCADHEIERIGSERIESIRVHVKAPDVEPLPRGLGVDSIQRPLRDITRCHLPTLPGEPQRVTAFAGADVECSARGQSADLVDHCAVRVAAPELLSPVAMIPIGLVR